jgi:hypothetical protein
MASESGYSNQKKLGISQFKTIHNVGSDKFGQSVASKALYEKTPEEPIAATEVIGKSGQIEFLNIYYPAHNALVNDVLRMTLGIYSNFEFDVISLIDADNFLVLPLIPAIDISGDSGAIMAWVTNKANADGSQIVTLAPVPLQFVKDSVTINVNEDTATPVNNDPLPTNNFFKKDGVSVPVSKDTSDPFSTESLPVEDWLVRDYLSQLASRTSGSLAPYEYDEVANTYVGTTTDLDTVIYSFQGNPVATLTFSYDGSNRLIGVVRS